MAGEKPTIGTEINRGGGGYRVGTDLLKIKALNEVASEAFKRGKLFMRNDCWSFVRTLFFVSSIERVKMI